VAQTEGTLRNSNDSHGWGQSVRVSDDPKSQTHVRTPGHAHFWPLTAAVSSPATIGTTYFSVADKDQIIVHLPNPRESLRSAAIMALTATSGLADNRI
jgi:hypothetical protein